MTSIVIFLVVYVVATFIKSSVKRAAESFDANRPGQVQPTMEVPEETSLEDLIKNVLASKGKVVEENVTVPSKEIVKPRVQRITSEMTASSQEREVSKPKSPSKEKEADSPIQLKTRDDARRAFIYSEIFNRKYE